MLTCYDFTTVVILVSQKSRQKFITDIEMSILNDFNTENITNVVLINR